jgi:hypothetical protein
MIQTPEPRRRAALAAGLALVLMSGACGGGEDAPSIACTDLGFAPGNTSPGAGDVFFMRTSSSCNTLDVGVFIRDLSDIFTVAFDLTYPSSELQYNSHSVGPLLQSGSLFTLVENPTPGTLQVSMSRITPDPAATATGNALLISFRFNRSAAGVGAIDFKTGGGSLVSEEVLDDGGNSIAASFGPGHGGGVVVP